MGRKSLINSIARKRKRYRKCISRECRTEYIMYL